MSPDYPLSQIKRLSRSRLLTWHRQLRCRVSDTDDDSGLTLIECLAAIVVVSFIGAAIAPVLVISVATRVQSQKAEQALALAQSEVDFVRTLLERGGDLSAVPLPPNVSGLANNEVATANGPNQLASSGDRYPATFTDARPVDIDNDGENDFGIQVYRTEPAGTENSLAFSVGVRVYDINAIDNATGNLPIEQASIGLASNQGDRVERPLATLYTTVASGEDSESLCNFVDFLDFESDSGDYEKPTGCPENEDEDEETTP